MEFWNCVRFLRLEYGQRFLFVTTSAFGQLVTHALPADLLPHTGHIEIDLIHDSRHVGFQIVMQISHVLCWGGKH